MTTNREQHELAAKAAGITITWKTGVCKGGEFEGAFVGDRPWRPKEDDGDSRRLQVALRMPIWFDTFSVVAGQYQCGDPGWRVETGLHDFGSHEAARSAVFMAAVAIGKGMQ